MEQDQKVEDRAPAGAWDVAAVAAEAVKDADKARVAARVKDKAGARAEDRAAVRAPVEAGGKTKVKKEVENARI